MDQSKQQWPLFEFSHQAHDKRTGPQPLSREWALQDEEIGRYRLGKLYSESFSGVPWELDIGMPTGIGREDSFNPYEPSPGGPQKTLRLLVLLHETSHYVHDMSLGTCMEIDYLWDSALAALLQVLQVPPTGRQHQCPILAGPARKSLRTVEGITAPLAFLEEREALASALLSKSSNLMEYACALNPVFGKCSAELNQLSGLSLLEGLVAVKTLLAITLRIKDEDDATYLGDIQDTVPLLPERLPDIYRVARSLFDKTVGSMLGISTKYYGDAWARSYRSSPRAISDEGFVYLADLSLHIPPFEYSIDRIRKGLNRWEDFIPVNRFVKAIATMLRKGHYPPLMPTAPPDQFYRTVFDFVAEDLGWPSYESTNHAWIAKLSRYKQLRQEATDGYRLRMVSDKHLHPCDITLSDCVDPCLRNFLPILHLTPSGLKILGGYAIGKARYYAPFEAGDMYPYYIMSRSLPLWKDLPSDATVDDLGPEQGNQQLFRQEIVYRIIALDLKDAVLYKKSFSCSLAGLGCEAASDQCRSITVLSDLPVRGCCTRFYADQKHLVPSRISWS